jgi:hypothetical protein
VEDAELHQSTILRRGPAPRVEKEVRLFAWPAAVEGLACAAEGVLPSFPT